MQKFKSKKGFTLAELLIVVAIIAVLTAIAVPLFVSALGKSEERVGEANCRAIRGLAISEILVNATADEINKGVEFWGYGKVNKNGEVSDLAYYIKKAEDDDLKTAKTDWELNDFEDKTATKVGDSGAYKKDADNYIVLVKITKSDVKA